MAFKFQPKDEKEVSKGFANLPPGKYGFTILESGIVQSKSAKSLGREMVALKINVHGTNFDKHIYDYFADWFSEWKLKHCLESIGGALSYLSGQIDPTEGRWAGKTGHVKIGEQLDKQSNELRNYVVDYCPNDDQTCEATVALKVPAGVSKKSTPPAPVSESSESDDVPF